MELKELRNATIVFVLGMFYHKYVTYMMDLSKTTNEKELISEVKQSVKDEV